MLTAPLRVVPQLETDLREGHRAPVRALRARAHHPAARRVHGVRVRAPHRCARPPPFADGRGRKRRYGLIYLILTTIPTIFEDLYHQRVGIAGLNYIALGVGLTGASQVNARLLDSIYVYFKKRNGGVGKPEFRLRACIYTSSTFISDAVVVELASMVPGTIFLPIGLLLFGWTAQNQVFWLVPDIVSPFLRPASHESQRLTSSPQGIAFVGAGMILNFQSIQTYVIDAFTLHSASGTSLPRLLHAMCTRLTLFFVCAVWLALAAVSCLRSLAGFGFPLFAPAMYSALGYGKGNTILAAFAVVIGCPA